MGNRPVVSALREMALAPLNGQRPHFRQIVLTAPDIDVDTFRQLANNLRSAADRITLYASSNDLALQLSKKYQKYQRLGDSVPDVVVLPDIDTIDVSRVDTSFLGHSYFGDNRTVLTDIFAVIRNGLAPSERSGLRPAGEPTHRWWIFAP
jgi:esterase/lipase superfamily enzyme